MIDLISIIMPAYNAETYIQKAVESILSQTYTNWELLIVDDGSTDRTVNVIKENFSDGRIRIFQQENQRLGAARNTGIRNAKGSWIAFLDSDDLWHPEKLDIQIRFSKNLPSVDVFFTRGYFFYGDDLSRLTQYETKEGLFDSRSMYKMEYYGNYIPILSVLVKTELVKKVGFQEQDIYFSGCEDWDYWIRMAKAGGTFYGINEFLFYYRKHAQSMSNNTIMMRLAQLSLFIKNYDKDWLTQSETNSYIKPLIHPLIIDLYAVKNISAIQYLFTGLRRIFPSWQYSLNLLLVRLLKNRSSSSYRLISKFNRAFTKLTTGNFEMHPVSPK